MSKPLLTVFDIESTGVSPTEDRIVTAFVGHMSSDGEWFAQHEFLIHPGIEIPQGAIDVHGITNEMAADGADPSEAVLEIAGRILEYDKPVVIFNAQFDATMLNAELVRYGYEPLPWDRVVDPYVIDRGIDMYRRGPRKLVPTAAHYGIEVDESKAHDASYDCLLAGRLALKLREKLHGMGPKPPAFMPWLMDQQRAWKAEQAASFESYMRGEQKRKPDEIDPEFHANRGWPVQD